MNPIEKTEKNLQFEKRRLEAAGAEILEWMEKTPPSKLFRENPWLLAGIAAGAGFFLGQWLSGRKRE